MTRVLKKAIGLKVSIAVKSNTAVIVNNQHVRVVRGSTTDSAVRSFSSVFVGSAVDLNPTEVQSLWETLRIKSHKSRNI